MKSRSADKKNCEAATAHELVVKAMGPTCNLQCKYCHYREKSALFPTTAGRSMAADCLDQVLRQQIEAEPEGRLVFRWEGGEPLLAGLDFFRRVVERQQVLAPGRTIINRLKTNGTCLDAAFARFLRDERFEVTVVIDGPEACHDRYRLQQSGGGSFAAVMAGIRQLQDAGTPFSTLTHVHRGNEEQPLEVYAFLRGLGAKSLHFEPIVEREANQRARDMGLNLATPPPLRRNLKCQPRVSSWSVTPPGFARFMIEIFERWVRHDVGRVEIAYFDDMLRRWTGEGSQLCEFREDCGGHLVVEHEGTVYACERFVYPLHERGNVGQKAIGEMSRDLAQEKFVEAKHKALPAQCKRCQFRFACNGGCPKHRFSRSTEGEPGLNYLCNGYRQMFQHLDPYMQLMRRLLERDREVTEIMAVLNRIPRAVGA
ncbi:MAG: anaerobic sulfatase maturase [Verrucomicrobiota bacterium]